MPHLVANRYLNRPFSQKHTVLWGTTDVAEPALAERATRLDFGPLHDAHEAEVVVAAIDATSDAITTLRKAYSADLRLGIERFWSVSINFATGSRR